MLIHYLLYEDQSKNLTINFFLDFYTFFKVYYSWIQLNPCHLTFYYLNYWSFLWAFSIILIKLAFWSTQIVTKIGTQRYQWTSISFFDVILYFYNTNNFSVIGVINGNIFLFNNYSVFPFQPCWVLNGVVERWTI